MCLEALRVPEGTRLIASRGADIPKQLNECISNMTGEWIWILGDDHTFEPDLLLKLLNRNVDVVTPVVPRRDHPYVPVIMHGPLAPKMRRYEWTDLPASGLFVLPKGDSMGQAGFLVRRRVLGLIGDPWFEGGKLTPGRLQEDQYFVKRIQDLGIDINIDCDLAMAHIANIAILPQKHGGRWYAGYRHKDKAVLWADA